MNLKQIKEQNAVSGKEYLVQIRPFGSPLSWRVVRISIMFGHKYASYNGMHVSLNRVEKIFELPND
jgi:hypothetical protein